MFLMRRLDRYVLSAFVAPFAVLSFLIVALFIILDLFGRFDEFLKIKDVPVLNSILTYYAYILPGILSQWLLPIITVISGLFAVSSLDRHHEIVAMLSSGISRQRLLLPLLFITFLISVGDYLLKSQVVPIASNKLEIIRAKMHGDNQLDRLARDVALSKSDKMGYNFWFAKTIFKKENRISVLFVTRLDLDGNWLYRLRAETAEKHGSKWILTNVSMQKAGDTELSKHYDKMELNINLTMDDLLLNRKSPEFLSNAQLKKLNNSGSPYVELISRPLTALTSFLLFLWSMIILFNSRQGHFLISMGHCIVMVMTYYAFSWVLIQLATLSSINPIIVLYLPISILLAFGFYFYSKMPT